MSRVIRSQAEAVWDSVVTAVPAPTGDKTKWCAQPQKLALVLVEPRCHKWLAGVLYRYANIYGGGDTGLYIFHGNKNLDRLKEITGNWSGVNYVALGVDNLTITQYSHLLTSASFYQNFGCQHILIIQCDTWIRRPIDPVYFNYNWCGAPWIRNRSWANKPENCGNGGFSLRNVQRMIEICRAHGPTTQNEDVFFNRLLDSSEYATGALQAGFSVEYLYNSNPCGLHASYKCLNVAQIKHLLS